MVASVATEASKCGSRRRSLGGTPSRHGSRWFVGIAAALIAATAISSPLATCPPVGANFGRRESVQPLRRQVLQVVSSSVTVATGSEAIAADSAELASSWASSEAVDVNTRDILTIAEEARDDVRFSATMAKLIRQRLEEKPGQLTVLEIGTGPFALFALAAARSGAKKVYAVEADFETAKAAAAIVDDATDVEEGVIQVIPGLSTAIQLPEKVDIVIASLAGGIATEENILLAIKDAQKRHLKNPSSARSYIPAGVATYIAPVSFALHSTVLAPPRYDELKGQPLRIGSQDRIVQLQAEPQLFESYRFSDMQLPGAGTWKPAKQLPFKFPVSKEVLDRSTEGYADVLRREGVGEPERTKTAAATSVGFSGIAFWPRLLLDEGGQNVIDSRGPSGEEVKSHWPTILSLMTPVPKKVSVGDVIEIDASAEFPSSVKSPVRYKLSGGIKKA